MVPPKTSTIGPVTTEWREFENEIHIRARGGTAEERKLARESVAQSFGESYRFSRLVKLGHWSDVMEKAGRLVAAGNVQMLRNSPNTVVAQVQGDNDTYQVEFSRDDPNSSAITTWSCECPWSQFSWGRTRQWKKYEGRVCSHCLAAYWQALRTPLDEDAHPANSPTPPPSQGPYPDSPIPVPGPGAALQDQTGLPPRPDPSATPPLLPPEAPEPQPAGVLPELPQLEPMPRPNSTPGAYLPSPANPIQYPGGTFSKKQWHFSADFHNGQVVQTNEEDWGTWVGRSDAHGSGQPVRIPKGSIGEVMGEVGGDLVQVLIMDKIADEMGRMQPYGAMGYFLKSELTPRPDIQRPGPAVNRRR